MDSFWSFFDLIIIDSCYINSNYIIKLFPWITTCNSIYLFPSEEHSRLEGCQNDNLT